MNKDLAEMISHMRASDPLFWPSKFWESLNRMNSDQISGEGLNTFKQTVARNYFTWVGIRPGHGFFDWVESKLTPDDLLIANRWAEGSSPTAEHYNDVLFTCMLWRYAQTLDRFGLTHRLEEPKEGSPLEVSCEGRAVSQDLANSLIEYYSIREAFTPPELEPFTVAELGAGYGRSAFTFLKAHPNAHYIIIDIPPALYISQHYLTRVLPEREFFTFRPFGSYNDVRKELEASSVVFLLPHQAAMLPDKTVNLFLTISSLHEMTMLHIKNFLQMADRLTTGFFYNKQWIDWENQSDGLRVRREDYPYPKHWTCAFDRQAPVQTAFFEAMFQITP